MAKDNDIVGAGGGKPPMPNMKRGVGPFLKEVGIEMRRVIWPTKAETVRLTSAVLLVCVLFVLYLWAAGLLVETGVNLMEGNKIH